MRLMRRLADAMRSPKRFAGLVRRIGEVVGRGELAPMLHRVRPRTSTIADYRAWSHALPAVPQQEPMPRFLIAVDVDDVEGRAALLAQLVASPGGATTVLARVTGGWQDAARGGELASLAAHANTHDASWIWWIAAPLRLAPDAARAIAAGCAMPGARIVYADHDMVDAQGVAVDVRFKPAWDAVQALERPYAGPLLVLHAGLATVLDDAEATGCAGQWLVLLDAIDSLPEHAIVHVPRVVAHVATGSAVDESRHRAAIAPRLGSLARTRGARIDVAVHARPWLRFVAPAECSVSIVIPTRDRVPLLETCLGSVLASALPRETEIVVVDNGSTDTRLDPLLRDVASRVQTCVVRMDVPFNFAMLCNAGVDAASGRVVVLLNNDCQVTASWLVDLVGLAVQPGIGAAGPLVLYPDGVLQSAGVLVGVNRTATSALAGVAADDPGAIAWCSSRRRVSALLGACLAVSRETYLRVGGMDERFAVSHNEVDFCLRLEAEGLSNVFTPYARVLHVEGGTRGFDVTPDERERLVAEERLFVERWGHVLGDVDPAHHPAFRRSGNPLALGDPALAAPRAGWRALVIGRGADAAG